MKQQLGCSRPPIAIENHLFLQVILREKLTLRTLWELVCFKLVNIIVLGCISRLVNIVLIFLMVIDKYLIAFLTCLTFTVDAEFRFRSHLLNSEFRDLPYLIITFLYHLIDGNRLLNRIEVNIGTLRLWLIWIIHLFRSNCFSKSVIIQGTFLFNIFLWLVCVNLIVLGLIKSRRDFVKSISIGIHRGRAHLSLLVVKSILKIMIGCNVKTLLQYILIFGMNGTHFINNVIVYRFSISLLLV
jgi:hypothetical protein